METVYLLAGGSRCFVGRVARCTGVDAGRARLIATSCGVHRRLTRSVRDEHTELGGEDPFAADPVRGPVPSRRHEPGARVAGGAVVWPPVRSDGERLLGGFLGEVEVAEEADEAGEDAAPLVAEDLLEDQCPFQ